MRFVVALLLLSCGAKPAVVAPGTCVSDCGSIYWGDDCEGFKKAEAVSIAALEKHAAVPSTYLCKILSDYYVMQRDSVWVVDLEHESHVRVVGTTECTRRIVEIAPRDWSVNPLAHEYYHVWQDCDAQAPESCERPMCDPMHYLWKELGVDDAIDGAHSEL